jgi:hypothetical protein
MAQASSAVAFFRAVIMLACLVTIPLAALFGTSLPDIFNAIKDGRWSVISAAIASHIPQTTQTNQHTGEPPRFEPPASATPTPSATRSDFAANQSSVVSPTGASSVSTATVVPANYVTSEPATSRERSASPLSVLPPTAVAGAPADAVGGPVSLQSPAPQARDPFSQVQQQLRQWGATYYLLESWGGSQQLYRFYCKMAVGGNPNFTRYFEAIDSDPLHAMRQVLQQVESWRAGQQ